MKILLILILLFLSINARENPFLEERNTKKNLLDDPTLLKMASYNNPFSKNIVCTTNIKLPSDKNTTIEKSTTKPRKKISTYKSVVPKKKKKIKIKIEKKPTYQTVAEPAQTLEELSKKYIVVDCCNKSYIPKRKKIKTISKKRVHLFKKKILFKNCFLTIKLEKNGLIILTKDRLIKKIISLKKKELKLTFKRCNKKMVKNIITNTHLFKRVKIDFSRNLYTLFIYFNKNKAPNFKKIKNGYLIFY
ncbi:MAG: hypothetical protein DSZ06_03700 [Sulfurospirillum sp.]|nr:MAG: hypothetical protein DSZ06_03700 [Sulfurospirillum sp.]